MQKLHLVGFTTDDEGLILSARRGARSGGYVLAIDSSVEEAVDALRERRAAAGGDALDPVDEAPRVESSLSVKEIQARLRQGRSVEDVAKAAGVEPSWVERFAGPVLAEKAQVVAKVRSMTLERARLGASALPIGEAVRRNLAVRGVALTVDEFVDSWSAQQVSELHWTVLFTYRYRGADHTLRFDLDDGSGEIAAADRASSQMGYAAPTTPSTVADPSTARRRSPTTTSRTVKERNRAAAALRKAAEQRAVEAERAAARRARERASADRRREREEAAATAREEREQRRRDKEAAAHQRAEAAAAKRAAADKAKRDGDRAQARKAAAAKKAAVKAVAAKKAAAAKKTAGAKAASTKKTAGAKAPAGKGKAVAAKRSTVSKAPVAAKAAATLSVPMQAVAKKPPAVEKATAKPAAPRKRTAEKPPVVQKAPAAERSPGGTRAGGLERSHDRGRVSDLESTRVVQEPEVQAVVASPPPRRAAVEPLRPLFRRGLVEQAAHEGVDGDGRPVDGRSWTSDDGASGNGARDSALTTTDRPRRTRPLRAT